MYNPFLEKISIASNIISETKAFLLQQGRKGFEGRVYWIGRRNGNAAQIMRIEIPEQIPEKTIFGVSVTVTQQANIKVARKLGDGEYIIAKVHSHPNRAYNSDTDKANPFLRHEGSISIIVANFARNGMENLSNCAVCLFKNGQWIDLGRSQVERLFTFQGGGSTCG